MNAFKPGLRACVGLLPALSLSAALAQPASISLKAGESADIGTAYWVDGCVSSLRSLVGVDVLDGPPGVALTIRKEDVLPVRQNCTNKVPGGTIVASVNAVPAAVSGTLKYRIRYNTATGPRQSTHELPISLLP